MISNSLFAAAALCFAAIYVVVTECAFLAPYKSLIFYQYGWTIAGYLAGLFVNLAAGVYLISRALFLKETGRKLAHLDRQLRSGGSISEELAERLRSQ